jgi:hypothetical protein
MANETIKDQIKKFVNFDVENDYYKEEDKDEIAKIFKEILYEDDVTVRKFLKSFFQSTKELANQYSLIGSDEEVTEVPSENEEPEDAGEEPEDAGEEPTEETDGTESNDEDLPESIRKIYVKAASNILYE